MMARRIAVILFAAAALACNVTRNLAPTRTPFPTVTPTFSPAAYGTMVAETSIAASQTPLPPPIPTHIITETAAPGATQNPSETTEPGACADQWFMPNPPTDSCPAALTQSNAAYEPFEHGFMLWIEHTALISVFFNSLNGQPTYANTNDPWHDGLPQSDPNLEPPDGLFQPIRGFGMVWRGESSGMPATPRDVLGWATDREAGYMVNYQCVDQPGTPDCFISLPDGRVIHTHSDTASWGVWNGPR